MGPWRVALLSLAIASAACDARRHAAVPPGYPPSYAGTIEAGTREGRLVIWSAVDRARSAGLLAAFRQRYPQVRVSFVEMSAGDLYHRFVSAADHGGARPDFLWSAAMDLQIKLVNDGYAQRYLSPERRQVARWANWKNEAWGTTAEPIVMIYNRRMIDDAAMPKGHLSLTRFLEARPPALEGKIATYDLPDSAVGYLYLSQDQQATHNAWRLIRAMAVNQVRIFPSAEDVLHDVAAGRSAIGYNILGSYALHAAKADPAIGIVLPRDYTLTMSRIAVIPAAAAHPNAARLFLDFLLSRSGQEQLVDQMMGPIRRDVAGPPELTRPNTPYRAIRVGPALLVDSDRLTREYVIRRWQDALRSPPKSGPNASRVIPDARNLEEGSHDRSGV